MINDNESWCDRIAKGLLSLVVSNGSLAAMSPQAFLLLWLVGRLVVGQITGKKKQQVADPLRACDLGHHRNNTSCVCDQLGATWC